MFTGMGSPKPPHRHGRLVSITQAAIHAGVSKNTVYRHRDDDPDNPIPAVQRGKLTVYKIGNHPEQVDLDEVDIIWPPTRRPDDQFRGATEALQAYAATGDGQRRYKEIMARLDKLEDMLHRDQDTLRAFGTELQNIHRFLADGLRQMLDGLRPRADPPETPE